MKNTKKSTALAQGLPRGRPGTATPLALAVLAALGGAAANAATVQVTTTTQKVSSTDGCSLQEAIYAAAFGDNKAYVVQLNNGFEQVAIDTECVVEDDGSPTTTIVLPKDGYFPMDHVLDDDNYTGPTATPLVLGNIVIDGRGAVIERVSGAPNFRAFAVGHLPFLGSARTGSLVLRDVHVRNFVAQGGNAGNGGGGGLGAGGAIYVHAGDLVVERSTFDANGALGGNGSRNSNLGGGGGGGGGMGGHGGNGGGADGDPDIGGGGGGGGGARGNGSDGIASCGTPCLGLGAEGGGGGGTIKNGGTPRGGFICGGSGGYVTLNPLDAPKNGQAGCEGGGGGGGRDSFFGYSEVFAGEGGRGGYGGGGGGGGALMEGEDGAKGGFGGGGGAGNPVRENFFQDGPGGGDGGFGAGGGSAIGASIAGVETASPGDGGSFAGNASTRDGGGGAGLGGAIFNHAGDVRIENSTFKGNYAVRGVAGGSPNSDATANSGRDQGGAIFSVGGSLTVLNSTIAENEGTSSTFSGPGIVVYAPGEDIFAYPGTETTRFTLRNSIIAGNFAGGQVVRECVLVNSDNNSVIFQGSGNLITANGNCTQGVVSTADPVLGQLQISLPGLTPTMGIAPPSPAIDVADGTTSLASDQRGLPRPAGSGYDIGAVEYGNVFAGCKDVTASAGNMCKATASINDGSAAIDGGTVTLSQSPAGPYSLGETLVTLTVTGPNGTTASCDAKVTVVDDAGPVISATLAKTSLSPNTQHSLVNVGLAASASDGCSTAPTSLTVQVYGDENDEAPTAPGTVFSPDAAEVGLGTLRLRAERSDTGNGRVYLIVTSGSDGAGNVGRGCSTVVVPYASSAVKIAAVNAEAASALAFCQANAGAAPAGYFTIGDGPTRGPKSKQ